MRVNAGVGVQINGLPSPLGWTALRGKKSSSLISFWGARGGPTTDHLGDGAAGGQDGILRRENGQEGGVIHPFQIAVDPGQNLGRQVI